VTRVRRTGLSRFDTGRDTTRGRCRRSRRRVHGGRGFSSSRPGRPGCCGFSRGPAGQCVPAYARLACKPAPPEGRADRSRAARGLLLRPLQRGSQAAESGPRRRDFTFFTGGFSELDLVGHEPGQDCIEPPGPTRILHEWNECWLKETQCPPAPRPPPFFRGRLYTNPGGTPASRALPLGHAASSQIPVQDFWESPLPPWLPGTRPTGCCPVTVLEP
jgi:hypothetical protein